VDCAVRFALKLRMELEAEKNGCRAAPRFPQAAVGECLMTIKPEATIAHDSVIEFVTMPVLFMDDKGAVVSGSETTTSWQAARPAAWCRPSGDVFLFVQAGK